MDNIKDDAYYVKKALESIEMIKTYVDNVDYEDFLADSKLTDATMFRLIQMAESIKKLSPDFRAKYNSVPWGKIIGFRNGIVHDYGTTDFEIVHETIFTDLDGLKDIFNSFLSKK